MRGTRSAGPANSTTTRTAFTEQGVFCRQDGVEIDVDFAPDGTEIFDFWRLRLYARSLPDPLDLSDQVLRAAVQSLSPLLTEVRPGWFCRAKAATAT
ncbi:DUF6896 domain-containing protein [Streptomyces indicus]|uniref:DUF6896 domain-containing protein n=1 Tax=Streptomyces indicus TaxID=417292 RepID=UPI003CCBA556